MNTPIPAPPHPKDLLRSRILTSARTTLLTHGFSHLNLDLLSSDLGISKKTLYSLFPNKEALAQNIIASVELEVQNHAASVLQDPKLHFTQKLHLFLTGMLQRISQITPHALRDIQRSAPALYDLILEVRQRNIPVIFSQLIRDGQNQGMIRPSVDPEFTAGFILHALQGMLQPSSLELAHQTPGSVFRNAMDLLFGGILTTPGKKHYEKLQPRA